MLLAAFTRRIRLVVPLLVFTLAACGGGGGGGGVTPSVPTTPAATSTPGVQPMSVISAGPNNQLAVTGTIVAMLSNGFQLEGGNGLGYFNVYTSSTTTFNNFTPAVGEFVAAEGTGTASSSLTATSVTLQSLPSQPVTVVGQVTAMITGGFTLSANGTNTSVYPIYSTTYTGSKPYTGEYVSVSGLGSIGSSVVAKSVAQTTASAITPTPSPTPSVQPTPTPSGSVISVPSGTAVVTGQIVAVSATRLTIQAGPGCGYMYINLNSSTAYFNGSPQVNQYGYFTGPGTRCYSITANSVSLSSTPFGGTSTISGTVAAQTAYGFTLNTSNGTVPVAMSSSTVVFGGALTVGASANVTAYGSTTSGYTATQIAVAAPTPGPSAAPTATPGPISTTHVMVVGFVYGYAGTPTSVPLSSISPYISWAFTSGTYAPSLRASGIKVVDYHNFWRNYTTDNPKTGYNDLAPGGAHAAAEAKDCSGNVIYDSTYGGGYEADARSSAALGHAQTVMSGWTGNNSDAVFSDDTGAVWGITLPCNYDQSSYDAAVNAVHSALGMPLFINALGAAPNPATEIDLVQPSNVLGAECELCYAGNGSSGDYVQTGSSWVNVENAEIGVVAQHKIFWDYARLAGNPSNEAALRTYAYASFLLGYDPSYAMFEEALSTASGFPVMPETGLVPMNPLTTASSASGYAAPGGAYFREFAGCYYRGSFVNNCAVAVNPGGQTVPIPSTSYNHSVSLSGSGVLDGGSVSFTGPQVTQLAPGTAAILFP